jgi:hypothetical protein
MMVEILRIEIETVRLLHRTAAENSPFQQAAEERLRILEQEIQQHEATDPTNASPSDPFPNNHP